MTGPDDLRAPTSTSRWQTNLHGFWILNKSVAFCQLSGNSPLPPITCREHAVHAVHEPQRRFEMTLLESPLTSL